MICRQALLRFCRPGLIAVAVAVSPALASEPRASERVSNASYVLGDGSIQIVGSNGLEPVIEKLNALFIKTHPEFKFRMLMKGSSTGIAGLTAGVSAFAPMSREAWPVEIEPFKRLFAYLPMDIHIGYAGYAGPGRNNPPAVYVNANNPIAGLTTDQLVRIFSAGNGHGDITRWEQLGVQGKWHDRKIHLYGLRDDGSFASAWRASLMDDRPFPGHYEVMKSNAEVIEAVADDPCGIGLVDYFEASRLPQSARLLALAKDKNQPAATGTRQEVGKGLYPLSNYIRLYVNRIPGKALEPFIGAYLRLALSQEGQAVIASFQNTEDGYLPLNADEIPAELAKLQ